MAREEVRSRLSDDVQLWLGDGLISPQTASALRERWQARELGIAGVVRYLGTVGASLAGLGLIGIVTAMSRSEMFATLTVTVLAGVFLAIGAKLALDPSGRYAISSRGVLALGALALAGAVYMTLELVVDIGSDTPVIAYGGLIWVPAVLAIAYGFRVRFALTMALLGTFQCVGSWASMVDHSTYMLEIDSPPAMAVFAVAVLAVGIVHGRVLSDRFPGFHVAYEAIGALYLNLSLLILSIDGDEGFHLDMRLLWIGVLTVAAIAQIVLGARLHNPRLVGFGVTFLAIDLFTRYFEAFWSQLHRGVFFLLGGAVLFGAGAGIERWMSRRTS